MTWLHFVKNVSPLCKLHLIKNHHRTVTLARQDHHRPVILARQRSGTRCSSIGPITNMKKMSFQFIGLQRRWRRWSNDISSCQRNFIPDQNSQLLLQATVRSLSKLTVLLEFSGSFKNSFQVVHESHLLHIHKRSPPCFLLIADMDGTWHISLIRISLIKFETSSNPWSN